MCSGLPLLMGDISFFSPLNTEFVLITHPKKSKGNGVVLCTLVNAWSLVRWAASFFLKL